MLGNLSLKELIQATNLKGLQTAAYTHRKETCDYTLSLASLEQPGERGPQQLVYISQQQSLLGFVDTNTKLFIKDAESYEAEFQNFIEQHMVKQSRHIPLKAIYQTQHDADRDEIVVSFRGLGKQKTVKLSFGKPVMDVWVEALVNKLKDKENTAQLLGSMHGIPAQFPGNVQHGFLGKFFTFLGNRQQQLQLQQRAQFLSKKQFEFATREEKEDMLKNIAKLKQSQTNLAAYLLTKIKAYVLKVQKVQKQQVATYLSRLKELEKQKTAHINKLEQQNYQLTVRESRIMDLESQLQATRYQLDDLKQVHSQAERQSSLKLVELQNTIKRTQTQSLDSKQRYQQLHQRYKLLQADSHSSQRKSQSSQEELKKLKMKQTELQQQISNLNSSIKGKETHIQRLNDQSNRMKAQAQKHLDASKKNLDASKGFQTAYNAAARENQELKLKVNKLEASLRTKSNQAQTAGKLNDSLRLKNISLAQQTTTLKKQIGRLDNKIQEMQASAELANAQLARAQSQVQYCNEQLTKNLSAFQKERLKFGLTMQAERFLHLFQGDLLHQLEQEKRYLANEIQKCAEKELLFTRVIYRCDPFNPTNFHKYIDQRPNLCIVIKLKNSRVIAGFSISPLSTKTSATQKGIICSLTEKKSFKLFEGKRSVTYDTFFLIFGNSELRLKQGENKFFTNFGIANSFYDSSGQKYTVLNGEGSAREQIYEDFQIFEAFFK